MVIPPLTVIVDQLSHDCEKYGISYVNISKVRAIFGKLGMLGIIATLVIVRMSLPTNS